MTCPGSRRKYKQMVEGLADGVKNQRFFLLYLKKEAFFSGFAYCYLFCVQKNKPPYMMA